MSTPSDTPFFDKNAFQARAFLPEELVVSYKTARLKERELTAALARVRELEAINRRKGEMLDALLNHCDKECGECSECSKIVCPHGCDMHFHHDGCPACAELGDDPLEITVQPHATTWLPIETAPKNGTHFLMLVPNAYVMGGHRIGLWDKGGLVSVYDNGREAGYCREDYATHWMPLPATPPPPPSKEKEG